MNLVVQGTGFVVKLSSSDQLAQTESRIRINRLRVIAGIEPVESLGARRPRG